MLIKLLFGLLFFTATGNADSTAKEQHFIAVFMPEIQRYAGQQRIIDALTNENRKSFSLTETLALDRSWRTNRTLRQQIANHSLSANLKNVLLNMKAISAKFY